MARKRVFIDAPDNLRCEATVKLRDGSEARCGRFWVSGVGKGPLLCTQHRKIANEAANRTAVADGVDSSAPDAANRITLDRRDLFDAVREAIQDALTTDENMNDEAPLRADAHYRTVRCLEKLYDAVGVLAGETANCHSARMGNARCAHFCGAMQCSTDGVGAGVSPSAGEPSQ